ncbi:hypothetical protein [Candidatus Thiosymbion oneisti]|uniref:hypothetical protein n=1 Tax=Candidatus Thiosymbion oneisti TaxID=589554 RepID=UPI001A9C6B5F
MVSNARTSTRKIRMLMNKVFILQFPMPFILIQLTSCCRLPVAGCRSPSVRYADPRGVSLWASRNDWNTGDSPQVFGCSVGRIMKATKGKANPQQVNALLKEKLRA